MRPSLRQSIWSARLLLSSSLSGIVGWIGMAAAQAETVPPTRVPTQQLSTLTITATRAPVTEEVSAIAKTVISQAEMLRYAIDLRSITQGRGQFSLKFSHYEEAPPQVSEQVIADSRAAAAN